MTVYHMQFGKRLMSREELQPSVLDNQTALAGGGQPGATQILAMMTRFTTVATTADSALLPLAPAANEPFTVTNASANSMNVFPAVGDAINALSANAAYALAAGKTVTFVSYGAGHFYTTPA